MKRILPVLVLALLISGLPNLAQATVGSTCTTSGAGDGCSSGEYCYVESGNQGVCLATVTTSTGDTTGGVSTGQQASGGSATTYDPSTGILGFFTFVVSFINTVAIPLVFALAFIFFLFGIFQYFIAGGANEEKRETGKKFLIWGIIALAVMSSVWGLVNAVRSTFGFNDTNSTNQPKLPTLSAPTSST